MQVSVTPPPPPGAQSTHNILGAISFMFKIQIESHHIALHIAMWVLKRLKHYVLKHDKKT